MAGYPISGWVAYAVCVGAGGIGAALTLLTSWRPAPPVTEPAAAEPSRPGGLISGADQPSGQR